MWTKIDDGFYANLKIMGLSDAAFRLYVTGLNWSVAQLTDGHIAEVVLPVCLPTATPKPRDRAVADLVNAGLWAPCEVHSSPRCWTVHDFADYQPTRESVEADRQANRERQRRYRDKQGTNTVSNALVTEPDPSRPVPTLSLVESDSNEPDRKMQASAVLAAFATAQGLNATPTWFKRNAAAAYEVIDRAGDTDATQLSTEFVPWAVDRGCRVPNGLPEFLGAWLVTTIRNRELADCDLCENRRLVAMADEPDDTATYGYPVLDVSDPDAAGWPITQCPECMPKKATAK